jgi:hypothetical protein
MPGIKHHIIGLSGFAGAGKDTVADLLVTHAGFRKLAFADALRAELLGAFQADPLTFSRREWKSQPMECLALSRCTEPGYVGAVLTHLAEGNPQLMVNVELINPRTPRQTMQWWGTQYRRTGDADYWARQVRKSISYFMTQCHERHFVVTDCRYANEVETLRAMGGWLWQVKRPGLDAGTTTEGRHSSAADGSEFDPDAVINNIHDIKHLQQLVLGEFWALDAGLVKVNVEIPA